MLARINAAKENDKGFTLIELLVVIIIIGILSAVAIPLFLNQQKKAQDAAAKADVSTLGKEIATYYVDNTAAPTLAAGSGATEGKWILNSESVGNQSENVVLDASTDVSTKDGWCVAVNNPKGDKSEVGFKYSAEGGLEEGVC
jgi:type IV pilus assembly protein PilA